MPCIIYHMQSTHRLSLAEGALTVCVGHTWTTPPFFQNPFPKSTFLISGIHPTPSKSGWIPFLINASPLSTIVSYNLFRIWFDFYSFAKDTLIIFSSNCLIIIFISLFVIEIYLRKMCILLWFTARKCFSVYTDDNVTITFFSLALSIVITR